MPTAPRRSPKRVSVFFYAGGGIFRRTHGTERWWDFDGFEGFPPFLPVFVFEPLHVWDWHMASTELNWDKRTSIYAYRTIPLRWSKELLVRTFLRAWLWLPLLTGLLFAMSCAHGLLARAAGLALFLLCAAGFGWLWLLNQRDRSIRQHLGRHRLGASDPVTWTDDLLQLLAPASTWFHLPTFADACESLLAQRKFSDAMWAARLCAAIENSERGEALTERVLDNPQAKAELRRQSPSALPREQRPWPLVKSAQGADAEFWYERLFDGPLEEQEDVQYAGHIGGLLAYSNEPDDPDDDEEFLRNPPQQRTRRSGPYARQYFLGGLGIIAATLLGTYLFVRTANWFRLPTLADQIIEEQRRQQK